MAPEETALKASASERPAMSGTNHCLLSTDNYSLPPIFGKEKRTVQLGGYKFEPWTLGNLICGGAIGIAVYAVDGSLWKLEPDQIMVTLTTALLGNGETQLYAVFYAIGDKGLMAIPLIKRWIVFLLLKFYSLT